MFSVPDLQKKNGTGLFRDNVGLSLVRCDTYLFFTFLFIWQQILVRVWESCHLIRI